MAVTAEQVFKAMQDAGKPVRPGDVAKALDVDSKEVSKAIDELKKAARSCPRNAAITLRPNSLHSHSSLPPPGLRPGGLLCPEEKSPVPKNHTAFFQ